MFYLDHLPEHKCQRCKKRATHQLMASGKIEYGYFCNRCGQSEVRRRNAEEKVEAAQEANS